MRKFYYGKNREGKLVRDRHAEVLRAQGYEVGVRRLTDGELGRAILGKMPEEIGEIEEAMEDKSREKVIVEVADLQTLVDSLRKALGISVEEVDEAVRVKVEEKGAFDEGVVMEWVGLKPEGKGYESWLRYFLENPEDWREEK